MLKISKLDVRYGQIQAVRDITLHVDETEIVCVVGPNGAGKSTTLLTIAGALTPAGGEIEAYDHSLIGMKPEDIARLGISLVPEGRHIFGTLSVEENLNLGTGMRRDKRKIREDLERVLDQFRILRDRLKKPAGRLSGGEQQQLAIARALMTSPRLIMLDEPSLGLAPQAIEQVYRILLELRKERGMTLLIVEQSTQLALSTADRLYIFRSGLVALSGPIEEFTDVNLIEAAYFGFNEHDASDGKGIVQ
jgi:branched-chain amino acid transport system ATP-binding protein